MFNLKTCGERNSATEKVILTSVAFLDSTSCSLPETQHSISQGRRGEGEENSEQQREGKQCDRCYQVCVECNNKQHCHVYRE